jgi:hypothetical protein
MTSTMGWFKFGSSSNGDSIRNPIGEVKQSHFLRGRRVWGSKMMVELMVELVEITPAGACLQTYTCEPVRAHIRVWGSAFGPRSAGRCPQADVCRPRSTGRCPQADVRRQMSAGRGPQVGVCRQMSAGRCLQANVCRQRCADPYAQVFHCVQHLHRLFPPWRHHYCCLRQPLTHTTTNPSTCVIHPANPTVRHVQRGIPTAALLTPTLSWSHPGHWYLALPAVGDSLELVGF